ncbi:PREDICTED: glutathione S-transferase C-terminal domain-containing protein homolog [Nicrophorus vespilloides]|uniref:Glutathione S-transferase C-terminal domain-containing protein homolog n=1 Tax=Nicrophorus vespilloides TaxID=110193 RepID=A0ABM1MG46_NICVS|nr:PREDICTED: glutathione S-transferase C-terminal domain-containing protein homolog [Nicrophorus vespilloides]
MDTVYLKVTEILGDRVHVNLETLLVLNVFKICGTGNVKLRLVVVPADSQPQFRVHLNDYEQIKLEEIPKIAKYCSWPVIVIGRTVVAGLCSVCRQIIKSSRNEEVQNLLGFREACLMACSESSIWTKLCEVDMIATVKKLFSADCEEYPSITLPVDLTRFEYHMEKPVRIHNVYKLAREKNNDKDIKCSVPVENLNLAHCFSEGPFITLSDVILFPCIKILGSYFKEQILINHLPLTYAWMENMGRLGYDFIDFESLGLPDLIFKGREIKQEDVPRHSLYSSDPKRYNPLSRIYTKQSDIENSLNIIDKSSIDVTNDITPFGHEIPFDWSQIPVELNPEGGALPEKRAKRKCEQLENLVKSVFKISEGKSYKIVDFCSGSGHLGLLLAFLLPQCEVILVENKERSLLRAKERVVTLNLTNVVLLQCNLDYFSAKFDVGVSLHACGVATDLVIQNCIENRAHFVSCPCCYGGVHDCYHLKYPRSKNFIDEIEYGDYLNLVHAADQTHKDNAKTKQGYLCMDVVDTDRKLYAESCGYEVFLGKLSPPTCTPKNNLIVGICK